MSSSAPLKILSSMATRDVLAELSAAFTLATSHAVDAASAGGVDVARRVQADEAVDVVVLAANAIDQLCSAGKLLLGSRVDLVKSGIAMAVRAGAARPDVDSEDAVRNAVLAAASVSYSTGPSGVYLLGLFERWGILDTIKPRIVQAPPGVPVGSLVARGDVALGFQQLSELLPLAGIDVLGPLPQEIQSITTFSAGLSATSQHLAVARAWAAFASSDAAAAVKRRHGLEPA